MYVRARLTFGALDKYTKSSRFRNEYFAECQKKKIWFSIPSEPNRYRFYSDKFSRVEAVLASRHGLMANPIRTLTAIDRLIKSLDQPTEYR